MKLPLRLSWTKKGVIHFKPSNSRVVIRGTSYRVSCLDATNGSVVWEYPPEIESMVVVGGTVFAMPDDGERLTMIDVSTGRAQEIAFARASLVSVHEDKTRALVWNFLDVDERVVASSLAVRRLGDNRVVWERRTEGPSREVAFYIGMFARNGDFVVSNKKDGELECVDFETGELRWVVNLTDYKSHPELGGPGTIGMPPLISGDECFAWNSHGLFVFDVRTGELR